MVPSRENKSGGGGKRARPAVAAERVFLLLSYKSSFVAKEISLIKDTD